MNYHLLLALAALTTISRGVDGYRILGLFPLPIRSHYNFYEKLMLALAQKGHDVDVLTHFPREGQISKLTQLSVAGSMNTLENNVSLVENDRHSFFAMASEFATLGNTACTSVLQHPMISRLKQKSVKYDLVIVEMFATDCLLPLAHIQNAPIVGISSTAIMPWADERMGNPDNPAYISNYFVPLRGKLSFPEKIHSTYINIVSKAWYHVFHTLPAEIRGREVFGDMQPIENIAKNTILYFANRHFSLDGPRPLVPGVIEIGGMHIEPSIAIEPKDLSNFVNGANSGVIYFSMGTLINMNTFSEQTLIGFLKVFKTLKQRVVMKLEPVNIPKMELPGNVYIARELPQIDILCNKNTKLFITHGGTLSVQEAAYCGVPILGIPFFPNHEVNIKNYVDKHAGIHLEYEHADETTLKRNITSILEDKKYRENAIKLSKLFKDRPNQPLDAAVYWTEYALKYGGKHMRSLSADLIIFEYLLVDVFLLVIAVVMLLFYLLYRLLQYLQALFDRPPPPKTHQEKSKKIE